MERMACMRYVTIDSLREGMKLGRTLYRKADIMLAKGIVLTPQYINSIRRCGFPGVYIEDDLSADIEVTPLISDELRLETTRRLAKINDMARFDLGKGPSKLPDITLQIEDIVSELYRNRDIMVNMTELSCHDNYTYSHSLNVAMLSILLGIGMKFNRSDLIGLGTGALLHDIGKINISKRILNKNGPLTDEEYTLVKKHPKDGYDYITKRFRISTKHALTILDHHERFDGRGYPYGRAGTEISTYGRICAVADVYDALNSQRPYRKALPVHECVEYIMAGADTQFDPGIVDVFIHRIAPYPLGTSVKLSNGWTGLVVANYSDYSLRPKLRIYQKSGLPVTPFEISLKDDPAYLSVTITGVI